ncbi:hypothetical protein H6B10_16865 [Gemmiger formicilis]|nr:hypothetical protein [Gemmiger formicilis]
MSSPRLMTTQWLPGAFCTWNQRSLPRAVYTTVYVTPRPGLEEQLKKH